MSFLSPEELRKLNFKHLGKNVKVSDKASIYNAENISIGDNSRIDDFCILSAGNQGISIGAYVHVACYSSLIGEGEIILEDFSGLSSRVSIYSSNDDYSGAYLTNPCVPSEFTNVKSAPVLLKKHVIIGAGCVILPNVSIGTGTAIGALSLVMKDCDEKSIYAGNPCRRIKGRKTGFEEKEHDLLRKLTQ